MRELQFSNFSFFMFFMCSQGKIKRMIYGGLVVVRILLKDHDEP